MKQLLGSYLRSLRGNESRLKFSKRIGLSYTFVREMELGNRLPSDEVLSSLAARLQVDHRRLFLYAYCDRSPALLGALQTGGWTEWLPSITARLESESVHGPGPAAPPALDTERDQATARRALP